MKRALQASVLALAVVLFTGCAPALEDAEAARRGLAAALVSSLDVRVVDAEMHFALHVTNGSAAAVELEFPTAQRFDFEVRRPGGPLLWSWSAERAFAQVVGTERLEPGESRTYRAQWRADTGPGRYVAAGRLTTVPVVVDLQTTVEVMQ
jgi:hypothetical protein